ncbi:MAG: arginine--tRNA ligase [bacterium]
MIKQLIYNAFKDAANAAKEAGKIDFESLPSFAVDRPNNSVYGDYSVNLGMLFASQAKVSPRKMAQILADHLNIPPYLLDKIEITGPGFINLFLKSAWLHEVVSEILKQGDKYGSSSYGEDKKILVEFVSANPNGPLSIPHGRGAVIGDVLCNALATAGYKVCREFYINDAATSTQMERFGESLYIRYLQECGVTAAMPEEGYFGEYVTDFARKIKAADGDKYVGQPIGEMVKEFTAIGREEMLKWQRDMLADFGVIFDNWFSENSLLENGAVEAALTTLEKQGSTFTQDGAVWLAATKYGDVKDRPLVRSNGKPTYLAADVAYHQNKMMRGFDTLIDIWGPDHHGYIARTKAAMAALGYSADCLKILVYHIVRLLRNSEIVNDGNGKGEIILLSELIEAVGKDAARFFFLMCSSDIDLNFDMDLAVKESPDNPIYYVQSAHARIASILRTAEERGVKLPANTGEVLLPLGASEAEISLIRLLSEFPEEVNTVATLMEPHRLTRYAMDVSREFHLFYERCPVLKTGVDPEVRDARLLLVEAAKITLCNVLQLLGVSAPEKM